MRLNNCSGCNSIKQNTSIADLNSLPRPVFENTCVRSSCRPAAARVQDLGSTPLRLDVPQSLGHQPREGKQCFKVRTHQLTHLGTRTIRVQSLPMPITSVQLAVEAGCPAADGQVGNRQGSRRPLYLLDSIAHSAEGGIYDDWVQR